VIEEIRQLGQTALQTWATRQEIKQSEAYIAANPSSWTLDKIEAKKDRD
jgi:hypothetical protein